MERRHLQIVLGHADVVTDMAFYRAMSFYNQSLTRDPWWKSKYEFNTIVDTVSLDRPGLIITENDILGNVSLEAGGLLICYGNCEGKVFSGSNCEVIIAGDVGNKADISGSSGLNLLVGGNLTGTLTMNDTGVVWIQGDLSGQAWVGSSILRLWVQGNCTGMIRRKDRGILHMVVAGFMRSTSLSAIAAEGFAQFHGSVGQCDTEPGLYHVTDGNESLYRVRTDNRWVIHRTGPGNQDRSG